jgi:CRP-like cAMP-binding protein
MSLYSDISQKPSNTADFLKCVPLFAELDPEQLAEIGSRLRRRSFAPGVTLFHQDMPGSSLYLIEKGRVRVFILGRTGIEITLNVIGPNNIFGELALLDNKPHSATALTLEPCVVWLLARTDMEEFLERYPAMVRALYGILVERVRASTHLIEALAFQDVQGRLAYRILLLAEHHGRHSPQGIEIAVPLTQGELATMVGASRESVNKALMVLRSNEMIRVEGQNITVINADGLQKMIFDRGR